MTFRIDRINPASSIVDTGGKPAATFKRQLDKAFDRIEQQINDILGVQAATAAANAAAVAANTAAATAQTTADNITDASSLGSSYVSGLTLTATDAGSDATISISAHTRHYPQPDGTTVDVSVGSGSLTGQAYDTLFYIYYDDASRAGGAVTYHSTTGSATAAQIGDRHTVGAVKTPISGGAAATGDGTDPPGPGSIKAASI